MPLSGSKRMIDCKLLEGSRSLGVEGKSSDKDFADRDVTLGNVPFSSHPIITNEKP